MLTVEKKILHSDKICYLSRYLRLFYDKNVESAEKCIFIVYAIKYYKRIGMKSIKIL